MVYSYNYDFGISSTTPNYYTSRQVESMRLEPSPQRTMTTTIPTIYAKIPLFPPKIQNSKSQYHRRSIKSPQTSHHSTSPTIHLHLLAKESRCAPGVATVTAPLCTPNATSCFHRDSHQQPILNSRFSLFSILDYHQSPFQLPNSNNQASQLHKHRLNYASWSTIEKD